MLDELGEVHGTDLAVRVNSVSSGLMEEDLRVIMAAQRLPATILLPKTNNVDDIILVSIATITIIKPLLSNIDEMKCMRST